MHIIQLEILAGSLNYQFGATGKKRIDEGMEVSLHMERRDGGLG